MGMIGFTLVGGAIYNAVDAGGRDAPAHEVQDKCGGHPQQGGQYHYHNLTPCLPHGRDASGGSELIGYALDGFGIYGPYEADGHKVTNADLDECHGLVGPVMWDGKLVTMYHYRMTDDYPYSVGCFRGTPVRAPRPSGGAGPANAGLGPGGAGGPPMGGPGGQAGPGGQGGPGGPGGNVLAAVADDLGVDVEALRQAVGAPPPDLRRASRVLGIRLEILRAAFMRHPPQR